MYTANQELIKNTVECIEHKINEPVTLDDLSEELNLSKYHLLRLFKALTGKTPMDYVRGRKLTKSLNDLLNTRLKIIDIAMEYAFDYEQTYIRAFRGLFDVSPTAYRSRPREIAVVPKYDTSFVHDLSQGIILEPYFCMKPEFYVTGMGTEIVHSENSACLTANKFALDFYKNYMPLVKDKIDEKVYIGLVKYSENPEYSNYYISSVEVASHQVVSEPLQCYRVPTNTYAVFKYIGFHPYKEININTLGQVYHYIDFEWVPKTKYNGKREYHFERVDLKVCSENYCEAEIFMPITEN